MYHDVDDVSLLFIRMVLITGLLCGGGRSLEEMELING